MPSRKKWLDALRAIAILMVVYGHCVRGWTEYFVFTSPVKMPLFFVISGYLFNPRNDEIVLFLKNVFRKLVIPWIVLGMIHYTNPVNRFVDLISGTALWFMPCLIIGETFWFFVRKFFKKKWQIITSGFALSALGLILSQWSVFRIAMFNTALSVQIYFLIGYLLRLYEERLVATWKTIVSVGGVLYFSLVLISMFLFPGSIIDVHNILYFNIPICVLMILSGCLTLFLLFKQINICSGWLVFIGQNTLIIYIVHGLCINLFSYFVSPCFLELNIPLPIFALFQTAAACVVCCILALFINSYFPELIGKKRVI